MRKALVGIAATASLVLIPATSMAAVDTRTVNSNAEPGDGSCATNGCTLREAINELNLDFDTTDQDRINIAFNSINPANRLITLGNTLTVSDPVAIASTGTGNPIISGNDAVRPFTISPGTPGDDFSFSGVAITEGLAPDEGGGVHSGGAIRSTNADLTIQGSAIVDSSAPGPNGLGGAISTSANTLTIENSTISGNTARGNGGGITTNATLTIRRSTISGNQTTVDTFGNGGPGGGINATGTTTIENSTISGNHTAGGNAPGGGARFTGATTLRDSTVFGNFTQNTSDVNPSHGGGIYADGTDVTVSNTIVAGNSVNAGEGSTGPDLDGAAAGNDFLLDYSLVGNTSSAPIVHSGPPSSILDDGPDLGPLQDNGGPNWTHQPGVTSPVLDKGSTTASTDQRGLSRPNDFANISDRAGGDAADIGAVEIQIRPPTFTSTTPASPNSDDTPTIVGDALDGTVRLYTDPSCTVQTGAATADEVFEASGITVNPVTHNATTTFYGRTDTTYGTSVCASGAFPNTISYTHADPPASGSGAGTGATTETGLRAAALKKCKKKRTKQARRRCRRRANQLPL